MWFTTRSGSEHARSDVAGAEERRTVTLRVNDEERTLQVDARHTLADVLRDRLGLTGTHLGCEQGVCGACTVDLDDVPTRSCLVFAVQAEDQHVRTVEGVIDEPLTTAVTHTLSEHGGLQCGFCTPGFVILIRWGLTTGLRDRQQWAELLEANLCRCGCYQSIERAVLDVVAQLDGQDRTATGRTG